MILFFVLNKFIFVLFGMYWFHRELNHKRSKYYKDDIYAHRF